MSFLSILRSSVCLSVHTLSFCLSVSVHTLTVCVEVEMLVHLYVRLPPQPSVPLQPSFVTDSFFLPALTGVYGVNIVNIFDVIIVDRCGVIMDDRCGVIMGDR